MIHITLYGKADCHLCHEARALLDDLRAEFELAVTEVDITLEPSLFEAYALAIPVIKIEGQSEMTAPIFSAELRRALRRAATVSSAATAPPAE